VSPEDVSIVDGEVGWADETIPIAELVDEALYRYEPGEASHILSGANVCRVRVDPVSGSVQLIDYAISYEVGRAINPLTLEGQIRGAAAQGMGGALLEEFSYTPEGQPMSSTFMDYQLPTAAEIPNVDVLVLELGETSEVDPIAGAKGAGEGGIIATAATITAAVADAIGPPAWSLAKLPLTPETIQRLARAETAPA
jgi:CO/xanthine dehydrogenase Mo-binding subunit